MILDIDMGYYNIHIFLHIKYMTTIDTKFIKFRYNMLPMGILTPGYIFQAKLHDLLGDIECVNTYIYYMLVLRKYGSTK